MPGLDTLKSTLRAQGRLHLKRRCSIFEPTNTGTMAGWAMDNKRGANIGIAATLALLGCVLSASTRADTLVVNDQLQVRHSDVSRPARGLTMSAVEAKFGAPSGKHDAVGTPPITRWDYPQFVVFFEKDRVIDAVLPPPASEPSSSPSSTPVTSAPAGSAAPASETQEPVAPTPASSPMPSDAPISSGAPNPPAAAPSGNAAPTAAPATPDAPAAPVAPTDPTPAAQTSVPAAATLPAAQTSVPAEATLPAAQTSPAPPTHSAPSSEDPMGVVPVSIGPSAATPAPSSATPAAPADPHP
jgi:hypothetical protein